MLTIYCFHPNYGGRLTPTLCCECGQDHMIIKIIVEEKKITKDL